MKVIHLPNQIKHGCQHTVKLARHKNGQLTTTAQHRLIWAKRHGHPPEQCGKHATYQIDGQYLCPPHAGQVVLKATAVEMKS